MSRLPKRTQKDEDEYYAQLLREEPIKTEIIVKLREENQQLWASQARLLTALCEADKALRTYREQAAHYAKQRGESDAVAGYNWDSIEGWQRVSR